MLSSTIDNDDLMLEILLRLPAKALIKFKSVNKTWDAVISSDPFLRRLHTYAPPPQTATLSPPPLSRNRRRLFYFDPVLPKAQNPRRPYTTIPNPKILSSCNGLMLLQTTNYNENRYYVHSPATKQSREISLPNFTEKENIRTLILAFDPSKYILYKIVAVSLSKRHRIDVYGSENGTWEQTSEPFAAFNVDFNGGVHCDGAVYWKNPRAWAGLYYDIRTNAVGDLPPVDLGGDLRRLRKGYPFRFLELDGRLHHVLMVRRKSSSEKFAAMFELHDDRSRWSLKYRCGVRQRLFKFGVVVDLVVAGDVDDGEGRVLVHHATERIIEFRERIF